MFKILCDKSNDGIIIVENDKIVYLNDRVSEIFGYPKEELIKMKGMELAIPKDNMTLYQFIEEGEIMGIPPNIIEFWISIKNKKQRCIQNRYITTLEGAKTKYRFITITDVTDSKLMIEELKESRNNLQRIIKILGVDDNSNKNVKYEDLLANFSEKLVQNEKIELLKKDISKNTYTFKIKISPSITEKEKNLVFLTLFLWDSKLGPVLNKIYPIEENPPFSSEEIGVQLFHSAASIYGQVTPGKGQGLLLDIENINKCGYIYFDIMPSEEPEYNRFMIALISPKINYFESLKIKEIFENIASKVKEKQEWDIKTYWEKVVNILLTHQL